MYNKLYILDNWNKFKSFIYISLFVHNLVSKEAICSECTDFCLQLCFSEKGKTTLTKPFTFWKWTRISKKNHTLKMKAHSVTHFENYIYNSGSLCLVVGIPLSHTFEPFFNTIWGVQYSVVTWVLLVWSSIVFKNFRKKR